MNVIINLNAVNCKPLPSGAYMQPKMCYLTLWLNREFRALCQKYEAPSPVKFYSVNQYRYLDLKMKKMEIKLKLYKKLKQLLKLAIRVQMSH